ncbi:response regulator [Fredinandcohnia sp. 179-A 10B2 NHS]|uniref:response regulator transcription factor n=1 Tax=Fredinandcohnia sp. 179-A 10B2 NHS TaxID=3235176 RepID=UPI0039A1080F
MVIADDEWMIRKSLAETIDWEQMGVTICGVAANGNEALEIVKSEKPHILLTDIRMPGLSGLALIEAITEVNPKMKTIILTGYSEFSYAQQAIRLGVTDFHLKPIDEIELKKSVGSIAIGIEKEEQDRVATLKMTVLAIMKGQLNYESSYLEGSQDLFTSYRVVCIEKAQTSMRNLLPSLPHQWLLIDEKSDGLLLLYNLQNNKEETESIKAFFEEQYLYGGVSELSDDASELPTLYKQAQLAKEQRKQENRIGCTFYEQHEMPINIQDLLDYIHKHYCEQLSLHELSATFYISDSYLSRIFKQYTGQNFIDYVTVLKINRAKELLAHSSLKTNEVSKAVGYTDPRYFSQIFKKYTGCTPSEYRSAKP